MKKINLLLTLSSLNAVIVIFERLSPTTQIILQPYSYLRVHEVVQMLIFINISVVLPFLLLKTISNNFETIKDKKGTFYTVLFIMGIYLYAAGNGLHEVASFLFNTFCDTKHVVANACGSMFANDYYVGNIIFFVGFYLTDLSLILLELRRPDKTFKRKDLIILLVNSFVFAFTLIAYGAFDRVLVGFWYTAIAAVSFDALLLWSKKKFSQLPVTLYFTAAYTIATIIIVLIRFH